MKSSISVADNLFALELFSKILVDYSPIPFFGTLLGLVREGKPIFGDDDVDFYVDVKFFDEVVATLQMHGFVLRQGFPNISNYFCQLEQEYQGHHIRVDFYFFEHEVDEMVLIDRWNFRGFVHDATTKLRVPTPLMFPLAKKDWPWGDCFMPAHSKLVLEFLYGIDWVTPMKKDLEYKIQVFGGRPIRYREIDGVMNILP